MNTLNDFKVDTFINHKQYGKGKIVKICASETAIDIVPAWVEFECNESFPLLINLKDVTKAEATELEYYFTGVEDREITTKIRKECSAAWKNIEKTMKLTKEDFLEKYKEATPEDFYNLRVIIQKVA